MEKVKDYILQNEGGTFTADLSPVEVKKGFMVSMIDFEYITKDIDDALKTIEKYKDIIKDLKGCYIGAWVDTQDDGKIYIDISKHIIRKRDAVNFAKKQYQKAIYSCKKGKSIYLDYDIKYYVLYLKDYKLNDLKVINLYDNKIDIPKRYRDNEKFLIKKELLNIKEL